MSTHADSIDIKASPDVVFDAIVRLEQMGKYSPENTGGQWIGTASGPAVGAKFKGTNASGKTRWSTISTVVVFERPSDFAFEVTFGGAKVARWSFHIETTPTGCTVTETWVDRRSRAFKFVARTPVSDRSAFTVDSIRATLENLKSSLEPSSTN